MIEIEGLPEGFEINSVTINAGETISQCFNTIQATIHLKKIKPRRIVLEEVIDQSDIKVYDHQINGIWFRKVKETDIPLNSAEPKLSLSVDECRNVRSLIKDFENLGWFINPERALLLQKITEFIKDK